MCSDPQSLRYRLGIPPHPAAGEPIAAAAEVFEVQKLWIVCDHGTMPNSRQFDASCAWRLCDGSRKWVRSSALRLSSCLPLLLLLPGQSLRIEGRAGGIRFAAVPFE